VPEFTAPYPLRPFLRHGQAKDYFSAAVRLEKLIFSKPTPEFDVNFIGCAPTLNYWDKNQAFALYLFHTSLL
jgi:hypothetical protein